MHPTNPGGFHQCRALPEQQGGAVTGPGGMGWVGSGLCSELTSINASPHCRKLLTPDVQHSSLTKVTLPIDEVIIDPAETVWDCCPLVPQPLRTVNKKYLDPLKRVAYFYTYPCPFFLIVAIAEQLRWTPKRERADTFGHFGEKS